MARTVGALGEFLRARRSLVRPGQVGLEPGPARQVPGLRREEVAMLAGVSTDYYVQLEQGRENRPSTQVLDALARVLRLDFDTHAHLRSLATHDAVLRNADTIPTPAGHALTDLIERWVAVPAMLVRPWMDVVARNSAADALYDGLVLRDNLARMAFLDERVAEFVPDTEHLARCTVATLRASAGPEPHAPRMVELIGELSLRSESFRRLWARHDAHRKGSAVKRFIHPMVGPLTLHQHVLTLPDDPELQLWLYQAEPGSESEHALTRLLSTAARPTVAFPADAG
ncbi:helix-turn-helix domain-containing protein [Pseudonocardia spinosispora]|uniref:helix-turn-helix domain-containing protein n=1 Tax=Pseudonocardia spinosispora TaxID=103441 RepID=UPI000490D0D0|nr:helix-turn-helix transcriptional regulator [Pseudonocardia spinosispora]